MSSNDIIVAFTIDTFDVYTIGATGTYRHSMDYFGNRSWMDNPKKRGMLGPTDEYYAGVNEFLDYAYDHPSHVSEGNIRCPCKSCKLGTYLNRKYDGGQLR